MITVNRVRLGTFYLYTPEEADIKELKYEKHWSEVISGEWTLTSDNLVVQCIRVKKSWVDKRGYRRRYLQFAFGHVWVTFDRNGRLLNKSLEALKYIEARAMNRNAPITFGAGVAKSKAWEPFFETYAQWALDKKINKPNLERLAAVFCSKHAEPYLALKVVLRQKEVKDKLQKTIIERMVGMGIEDPEAFSLKLLKKAAEIAEKDRNPDAMIKVAKEFNVLLDAYPKKSTIIDQLEMKTTRSIEESIEREEKQLQMSRKIEE